jgi:hypothetical protein
MPKFFFNTMCPDRCTTDLVGEDCRDWPEAERHARRTATRLVTAQLLSGEPPTGWIEVEDEDHRPVLLLPVRSVAC